MPHLAVPLGLLLHESGYDLLNLPARLPGWPARWPAQNRALIVPLAIETRSEHGESCVLGAQNGVLGTENRALAEFSRASSNFFTLCIFSGTQSS